MNAVTIIFVVALASLGCGRKANPSVEERSAYASYPATSATGASPTVPPANPLPSISVLVSRAVQPFLGVAPPGKALYASDKPLLQAAAGAYCLKLGRIAGYVQGISADQVRLTCTGQGAIAVTSTPALSAILGGYQPFTTAPQYDWLALASAAHRLCLGNQYVDATGQPRSYAGGVIQSYGSGGATCTPQPNGELKCFPSGTGSVSTGSASVSTTAATAVCLTRAKFVSNVPIASLAEFGCSNPNAPTAWALCDTAAGYLCQRSGAPLGGAIHDWGNGLAHLICFL